ncbi:MAG: hypothetical protein ACTSRS_13245 [Candidatus Helarchaeota archaeon]
MQNIESILSSLWQANQYISAITILHNSNNSILYQTSNWDITPDLNSIWSTWNGQGPAVEIQGIRYTTLQCTPERLVCSNLKGQGHIIAVNTGKISAIAYVLPDGDVGGSYTDVARVIGEIGKFY